MVRYSTDNHFLSVVFNNEVRKCCSTMVRNISDNEKIEYIVIGILIGMGLGYMIAMWIVAIYG